MPFLSYQSWTGGHRLPFLVSVTTASFRNLGPPLTIVLSNRKYGSLLTPSIHWVSCVRLPCPVFIFFAFCLCPPYRAFLTSTKPFRGWYYLSDGEECSSVHLYLHGHTLHSGFCILPWQLPQNSHVSIRWKGVLTHITTTTTNNTNSQLPLNPFQIKQFI